MFIRKRHLYGKRPEGQAVAPDFVACSPRQPSNPISVVLRGKPQVAPGLCVRRIIFNPASVKQDFWACLNPCLQSAARFDRLAPPLAFRINALSAGDITKKGGRKRKGAALHDKYSATPHDKYSATPHDKYSATPHGKAGGFAQERGGAAHGKRLRLRLLVLQAKRLPYLHDPDSGLLYVPRLCLGVAVHEITAFESERDIEVPAAPGRDNWLWVIAFLSLLLFWDALRYSARSWGLDFLPHDSGLWVEVGALVKGKVLSGEWWRLFTALTLHADASHVLGNCVFGAIFMLPLCSRAGLGGGVFMTVLGGAFGNLLNIFFQAGGTRSIGFSTAVFAALGALCGLAACRFLLEHSFKKSRGQGAGIAGGADASAGAGILGGKATSGSCISGRMATSGGAGVPDGVNVSGGGGFTGGLPVAGTGIFAGSRARGVFLCLAAGLGFLAFLGGSGEPQVDFSAHVLGLIGGLLVSLPFAVRFNQVGPVGQIKQTSKTSQTGPVIPAELANQASQLGTTGLSSRPAQLLLLLIPLGLVGLSWYLAFTQ